MIIRYLSVGILNTTISLFFVFICIYFTNINYQLAYLIGYVCGTINSFIVNKTYTFKSDAHWKTKFIPFVVVVFGSYIISHIALIILIEKILLNSYLAVFISMILYTIISFILLRGLFKS